MSQAYERPTVQYKLIYVYSIDDAAHAGYLKIGEATVDSDFPPENLPPNCSALNKAAHARIKQETCTAAVEYQLEYTEVAIRYLTLNGGVVYPQSFGDKKVHQLLKCSGIPHKYIGNTKGREWFELSLETVKNAIAAVKDFKHALGSGKVEEDEPITIVLREEQKDAIKKTLKRFEVGNTMLWDAKMRFGKTLTALQLIKDGGFKSVLIATHRPVVKNGWQEDFYKLFTKNDGYDFFYKESLAAGVDFDAKNEKVNDQRLKDLKTKGAKFIYFASVQDLRGSQAVGGKFKKNEGVFDYPWDLIIVDEAHEGLQTDLGEEVKKKLFKKKTKVLSLSGTPFNILGKFDEDSVFVWEYVMEQKTKDEWSKNHPDEPNPYASLPRMNIYTYDLGEALGRYDELDLDGKAFNFREFFRTWTGNRDVDGCDVPKGAKIDDFVHEGDVKAFLDLITTKDVKSCYPYATDHSRSLFKHTLWMVPGVKAARALSELLRKHPVFGEKVGRKTRFGIANVAGEGDDYEDTHQTESLELVRKTIREHECSITLSCGRLTTGVTVKEWTGVLMLAGSVNTSASSYMQTIFRVQSPGEVDGKVKTDAYVFDFAPDRTLNVLATASRLTGKAIKRGETDANDSAALGAFLNYCPVVAISGTKMEPFSVERMMGAIKRVFIMQAIKNGFADESIYNQKKLQELKEKDLEKFEALRAIIGTTKQTEKATSVVISDGGFADEETGPTEQKPKKPGQKPDADALERKRKREQAKHAASILRAISIRIPMLIYGADVPSDKVINLIEFIDLVDDESWNEFMPLGVTKKIFKDFIPYYDADVVGQAGLEYRKLAKMADKFSPTERIKQIALIFKTFRNPDKETVLTPWNVVNRHLSDTIGGWTFFDERFDPEEPLEMPRYVNQMGVTDPLYGKKDVRVLEINSKSGLYPLYVAYSIYRRKCGELSDEDIAPGTRVEKWREVLRDNIFVVCKTPMAALITKRTLAGYDKSARINAVSYDDVVATLKDRLTKFVNEITSGKFWKREEKEMKFDAVVGNPPYQLEVAKKVSETNGQARRKSIFHYFQMVADKISNGYTSLIYPGGRWIHRSGKGMEEFGLNQINDPHLAKVDFYPESSEIFSSVAIADGISIVFKDVKKTSSGFRYVYHKGEELVGVDVGNPGDALIPLNPADASILEKVGSVTCRKELSSLNETLLSQKFFGVESDFVEKNPKLVKEYDGKSLVDFGVCAKLFTNDKAGKAGRSRWYVVKRKDIPDNAEHVDDWKVVVSSANAGGQKRDWQLEIFDNHSAFGRSRLGLKSFKTRVEAENFYVYCKTYLVRFLFLMTDESLTSLGKRVPDLGDYTKANKLIDFSKDLNAQLYKLFGLSKSEIKYVEKTVKELDASRSARK